MISDWGSEGVESAARIVGREAAEGMLANHVRQNVQQAFPNVEVSGNETEKELKRKVVLSNLSDKDRQAVEDAEETLRRHGLLDD